ncbi:MAG: PG0541 family transporter-associated protein [Bacteroidota bacterium]
MKLTFLIYHDVLEDRVQNVFDTLGVDYYTKWEEVKGKGHETDAHLGTRTFPGYNYVRMVAFDDDAVLVKLITELKELNKDALRPDDKIRLFQMPLELVV